MTDIEERKRPLAEAVLELVAEHPVHAPDGNGPIRVRGDHAILHVPSVEGSARPDAALVLSRSWLRERVWPEVFAGADVLEVALLAAGDELLYASQTAGLAEREGLPRAVRAVQGAGGWRVHVQPLDPVAFSSDFVRRQNLTLVSPGLVVVALAFGTYLTSRGVAKEMEIARMKADFLATVSHEFRSPLTGIRQLGELLARGRVPDEQRRHEYYERITQESERLARLVENLLDFSRMEEGRKEYRFEVIETGSWVRAAVAEFRRSVNANGASIEVEAQETLPAMKGDREALTSALHNLLDNAVKYSQDRSSVRVEAEAGDGRVAIRVRDRGVGISAEDRSRIFEKFYRGDAEITRRVKGAGIGLSLVRHVVAAHGGQVGVDSAPGSGSTFTIVLPAG